MKQLPILLCISVVISSCTTNFDRSPVCPPGCSATCGVDSKGCLVCQHLTVCVATLFGLCRCVRLHCPTRTCLFVKNIQIVLSVVAGETDNCQHANIQSFNHSIIQSFNHSIIQSFNHSIIQSFNHSIIQSFNHSIIQSFNHSIIRSLVGGFATATRFQWKRNMGRMND